MLNKFDLRFADFLQDEGVVTLQECEYRFEKSQSTLKRCIYRINDYLSPAHSFLIKNNQVISQINRENYEQLCQNLPLKEYATVIGERFLLILFTGFFEEKVNLTKLYEQMELSQTTRKKDSRRIKEYLKEMGLYVENHYNQGIAIRGLEENYRNYIALKLSNIIELDREDRLTERKANTPVQKLVYRTFIEELRSTFEESRVSVQEILEGKGLAVDYASKKFLYIYHTITTLRINKGHQITKDPLKHIKTPHFTLFEDQEESTYMDKIMGSLNYKEPLQFPENPEISNLTNYLITMVEREYDTVIYTKDALFEALYAYIYKCKLLNSLGYSFYDHKLERTHLELEELYLLLRRKLVTCEESSLQFTRYQLSVVCLIIETFISKNQIAGAGTKRIVIITNSSAEKVDYFEEKLKHFIEFKIVGYATINELHKLSQMDYDEIIVFSSRIQTLLKEHGYQSLRINFYVKSEDVKELIDAGFTSNQNAKLVAENMLNELEGKSKKEKLVYLKKHYGDYFL